MLAYTYVSEASFVRWLLQTLCRSQLAFSIISIGTSWATIMAITRSPVQYIPGVSTLLRSVWFRWGTRVECPGRAEPLIATEAPIGRKASRSVS